MAKSLRAKTKRSFRKIKREDPKSDYKMAETIRLQRLNEKLKVLTPHPRDEDEDEETVEEEEEGAEGDESMAVEGEAVDAKETKGKDKKAPSTSTSASTPRTPSVITTEKVSTGGPRDSGHDVWKKAHGLRPRPRTEKNSTTFTKKKSFKSTGKAKKGGRK